MGIIEFHAPLVEDIGDSLSGSVDSGVSIEVARQICFDSITAGNEFFEVLGADASGIILYLKKKHETYPIPPLQAYKNPIAYLLCAADIAFWKDTFSVDDLGTKLARAKAWEVIESMGKIASMKGKFDLQFAEKGLGVHMVGSKIIVHLGDGLVIDGHEESLGAIDDHFFTRDHRLSFTRNCADSEQLIEWTRAVQEYRFEQPSDGVLFIGWLVCAMIGGALDYRPHAWVRGKAGSGKTWLVDKVVQPLMAGGWGDLLSAKMTGAALARLCQNTLPIVIDEAESTARREGIMNDLFEIMRTASASGDGTGYMIKAGAGARDVIRTQPRCCFMLLSISLAALKDSERSRISSIKLGEKGVADWEMVSGDIMAIMKKGNELRSRIILSATIIKRSIATAYQALSHIFERLEERQHLHFAALFGAAIWATEGGAEPRVDDPQWKNFEKMIIDILERENDRNLLPDNERIIDTILTLPVTIKPKNETHLIGELTDENVLWDREEFRAEVNRQGVNIIGGPGAWRLLLNPKNNNLLRLLRQNAENTPANLGSLLETSPNARWVAAPPDRGASSFLRRLGVSPGARTPLIEIPIKEEKI